jgi:tetratricopeptide (TPR) repeat protein
MQPHPDLAYPIGLAREVVEAATRLGDEDVLLDALFLGMSTMMDIVDPAERLLQNLRIEQLVTVRRDAERLLRTHARLVFDHMELGELAEADARIDAFERLGKDTGADRYLWRVPLFRSMRAMMHGRFAESEALVEQARELGTASKDPQFERCYVLHREGLLRMWERHDDMIAYDVVARPMRAMLYSGPHWQNGGTALTYSRVEDFENAKLYADLVPQDDWPLVHNPPAFAHVGEPMAHVGGVALVTRVYVLLLPARERCISWGWTKILWEGTATRVLGLLAARLGRTEEAISHFESAIETLAELAAYPMLHRTRYEYGRWLLSLGGAHEGTGRALVEEARAGAADLGMTGLVRLAEKRLGEARAPVTPPAGSTLVAAAPETGGLPFAFVAEGEYWTVQYEAATFRLKDSLGLQYLTRLFAEPHRSIHVLELSGSANEPSSLDAGDAGEHLDAAARDEYRLRLTELREQLEAAKASGAVEQATRLEEEMDFLEAELSRAFGLGGRVRRAGAASERARSAVQRRIRSAVERVREYSPGLAALLERTVKTGTTCVFSPENARDAAARD